MQRCTFKYIFSYWWLKLILMNQFKGVNIMYIFEFKLSLPFVLKQITRNYFLATLLL